MNSFIALDVETANADMATICQIGLVEFLDGQEIRQHSILINPQTWFDDINTRIHGIREFDVVDAPTFSEFHREYADFLADRIVVSHTHFDRISLARACARDGLADPKCTWLDSARVARRVWAEVAQSGYGLANLAAKLGLELNHHDAVSDARTCGNIVLRALEQSGLSLADCMVRAAQPVTPSTSVRRTGDGNGGLIGETIVFTGALILPRREAADRAASAGGDVGSSVISATTMLVVGDQDIEKLAGKSKSSKHLKAEQLISNGHAIRIVGESDFLALSALTE